MVELDLIGGGFSATVGSTFQQQACSYRLIFTDTTTVSDNTYNKWTVTYTLLGVSSNITMGSSSQNGTTTYDFCREGNFQVRQTIIIYDTDCVTPIYREYVDATVDVDEVYPVLDLPTVNCCYPINTALTITPDALALNNNQCETTPIQDAGFFGEAAITVNRTLDQTALTQVGSNAVFTATNHRLQNGATVTFFGLSGDLQDYNGNDYVVSNVTDNTFQVTALSPFVAATPQANSYITTTNTSGFAGNFTGYNGTEQILRYKLSYYDLRSGSYLQAQADQTSAITSTTLSDYPFTFTPDKLTRYKLEASVTNCCQTVTKEVEFVICDAISIESQCKGVVECTNCKSYDIFNYTDSDITIEVKDLILNKTIHNLTVTANSKVVHTFTEDSVYSFTYTNPDSEEEQSIIVVNSCDIDKCYTDLLKLQLCNTVSTTDCCDDRFLESRLANIQALYQTYLHKIEEFTDLNLRFAVADITNRLDDFQKIGKIRDQLLTFCKKCRRNCGSCFEVSNGSCI